MLQASGNFIKKETDTVFFSCEFWEIYKIYKSPLKPSMQTWNMCLLVCVFNFQKYWSSVFQISIFFRNICSQAFYKEAVLRNFAKFTGKLVFSKGACKIFHNSPFTAHFRWLLPILHAWGKVLKGTNGKTFKNFFFLSNQKPIQIIV